MYEVRNIAVWGTLEYFSTPQEVLNHIKKSSNGTYLVEGRGKKTSMYVKLGESIFMINPSDENKVLKDIEKLIA